MKNTYTLFLVLLLIIAQTAFSQNLVIDGLDIVEKSADIKETNEIQVLSKVTNTSTKDIKLRLKINVIEMPFGHSYGACWAGGCLPASTDSWDKSVEYLLPAGTTMPDYYFVGHYYCNYKDGPCITGTGKFCYTFFNAADPKDSVSLFATLTFLDATGIAESVNLSDVNVTCSTDNILRITSKDALNNFTLSLFSINGGILCSQSFSGELNYNISNFTTGFYLYTITSAQGKIIAKGKILKS